MTGITNTAGANTIAFANYSGYDKSGNRKNKITPSGTESYQYDNVYRLTQAVTPKGTENYSYDDVGNRLSGPGSKDTAYAYDAANRMTNGRQLGYGYDNAGNQIARTIASAPAKGWTQAWDLENKLKQADKVKKDGNGVVIESRSLSFKYDPFGRRIEKKLTTLTGGITKISTWTYVYDDNCAGDLYRTGQHPREDLLHPRSWHRRAPGLGAEWAELLLLSWFSVNRTFGPFVINHHKRREVHEKETSQLHP